MLLCQVLAGSAGDEPCVPGQLSGTAKVDVPSGALQRLAARPLQGCAAPTVPSLSFCFIKLP